ncbi:MAG: hypothetical protein ACKV2V_13740, partial [Blastocatellia bacterium]
TGPGSFRFDINLVKRVKIRERVDFEFRADAINAFNKPIFDDYDLINTDINSRNFGRITGATGTRLIVLAARINC